MTTQIFTLTPSERCDAAKEATLQALESGKVIFLPEYCPEIDAAKRSWLEKDILDGKHKNLSYNPLTGKVGGLSVSIGQGEQKIFLENLLKSYVDFAHNLIALFFPLYKHSISFGRTSYRPAQISGRISSKRKDDTRLHVDAFPASPVNGKRILRVFSNINFDMNTRNWMLGESFETVLERFYPSIPHYRPNIARILHLLKATKERRSAYDHVMLQIHDRMKLDDDYQNTVSKEAFNFPAMSSWVVFTDKVSHAALGGQYLLEQTFYLPVEAMQSPELSPYEQIMRIKTKA